MATVTRPLSSGASTAKRRNAKHEQFRKVTGAAIRALSGNKELEASFAANSRGRIGNDVYLPMPGKGIPQEDKAKIRGQSDQVSLKTRYHNAKLHMAQAPAEIAARQIFDALEDARCEAIGCKKLHGVRDNISAAEEDRANTLNLQFVNNRDDAPLHEAVRYLFRERVLDPLGMTETGFAVTEAQLERFATLYTPLAGNAMDLNNATPTPGTLRVVDTTEGSPFRNTTCFSGGGGLVGTIDNYMAFAECLRLGGQGLVSPSTIRFMLANHLPGDIASLGPASFAEQPMEGMGFGIGGAVVLNPARSRVPSSRGDFSWGGMASTFFWIDPVHDVSCVLFTQLSPSSATPARAELKALVHGALM